MNSGLRMLMAAWAVGWLTTTVAAQYGPSTPAQFGPSQAISGSSRVVSGGMSIQDQTADLQLPDGLSPGFLKLPDGRRYAVSPVEAMGSSLAAGMPVQPKAMTGNGAGGATGESGEDSGNGTNPAQNVTTLIASNEYYKLSGGNQINTTYSRLKVPMLKGRGSLLVEMPLTYFDFTSSFPNTPEVGGLGDMKFQLSYNTWSSCDKKLTMINFFELYVPSADSVVAAVPGGNQPLTAFNLGTGQFVLGPGIGFVYAVQPNFIIAPLYFYEASAAGDDSANTIRRGKWRIFGMYAFKNGMYVLPEFQVLTDYLSGNNDTYVAPEIGYSKQGSTFYVKPGIGCDPDFNDREWGIDFGVRVTF